jgi:predicted porin
MRKSALALALALAFPAAYAQQTQVGAASRIPIADESLARGPSRVELYGILDGGIERQDVGSVSSTRLSSGMASGSRWGLRGAEVLGGGLRAIFTLESRIEIDQGSVTNRQPLYYCDTSTGVPVCPGVRTSVPLPPVAVAGINAANQALLQAVTTVNSAGALFDRQAFIGLVTPVGAVLVGRQYTPGYEVMNRFNSFADATAGQFGQGYSALAIRANNALQYRAEAAGFTLSAMYGFGGTEVSRQERSTDPQDGDDFMGANLQYQTPVFSVGLGWNRNNVVPYYAPGDSRKGLETLNFGVTGTLGSVKLFGMYMTRKNDNPVLRPQDIQNIVVGFGAGATNVIAAQPLNAFDVDLIRGIPGAVDTTIYHLGAQWTIGNGVLHAAYNNAKEEAPSAWDATSPGGANAKVNHYALAYFYNFSRRTQLYGAYALAQNDGSARMALGGAGYAGGFSTAPGEDASAIQLGLRHAF